MLMAGIQLRLLIKGDSGQQRVCICASRVGVAMRCDAMRCNAMRLINFLRTVVVVQ